MKVGVQLNPQVSIDKAGQLVNADADRAGARCRSKRL
jgi:hypothetical protein